METQLKDTSERISNVEATANAGLVMAQQNRLQMANMIKQNKLENVMEISGISENKIHSSSNLKQLAIDTISSFAIPINSDDICKVTKKEIEFTRKSGQNIKETRLCVHFYELNKKVTIMQQKNKIKEHRDIYFNIALTHTNNYLLRRAKYITKGNNLRTGFYDCVVRVKKADGKDIPIYCENDLDELSKYVQSIQSNQSTGLAILQINIRGINKLKKFDKLKLLLSQFKTKPDVIVVGETKLKPLSPINIYNLVGYAKYFQSRSNINNGSGGGLLVFVRKEICINSIETASFGNTKGETVEKIKLNLKIQERRINLLTYYRSPHQSNATVFLSDLESEFQVSDSNTILIGDVNINILNDSNLTKKYTNLLSSYNFKITNNKITRNTSGSIIDHVLSNFTNQSAVTNHVINMASDFSDHNMILSNIANFTPPKQMIKKTIYKTDYKKLELKFDELASKSNLLVKTDPNEIANDLINITNEAIKQSTTSFVISFKNENFLWWSNNNCIRKALETKKKIASKLRKNRGNSFLKAALKEASYSLKLIIKYEKKKNMMQKFCCKNPKKMWKNIDTVLGRNKSHEVKALKINDELIEDRKEIAVNFNNHFIDSIEELVKDTSQTSIFDTTHNIQSQSLFIIPPDVNDVKAIIKNLRNSSCGYDKISTLHVKCICDSISPILQHLITCTINTGIYPDAFKIATVVPINKTGDIYNINDYRPISVLTTFNKIIEKFLYDILINFLEKNKILFKRQFGFRRKCGTEIAAAELISHIKECLDNKEKVTLLMLDMMKAFDVVDRSLLLASLESYGIRGKSLNIFKNYLDNRIQKVKIGNDLSQDRVISYGVVQGSVLGPLLFSLYINDIHKLRLNGQLFMYADDMIIACNHKSQNSIVKSIQEDMEIIVKKLKEKRLLINEKKTTFMIIHSPFSKITPCDEIILSNGNCIRRVDEARHLGLIIDKHLKWDSHCDKISSRLSYAAGALWKLKYRLPLHVKKNIYHTLFESHLSYMSSIWGSASNTTIKEIQIIQNRALRNVFNIDRLSNRINMYTHLVQNCLPIRALHFLNTASLIYNTINRNIHCNMLFKHQNANRTLRHNRDLHIATSKTNYGSTNIYTLGSKIYNSIPADIKSLKHRHAFKWALKCSLRNEKFISGCFNNNYLKQFKQETSFF
ncbi:hypothetical protein PVAND_014508 [Polypedilum vanderplanki]|uniref:Reverse transcriptase domain-containing protein n=1 Tax=Polypedilum vanderplanki TaxID=319348 RepID=A0A9J6B9D3_POLVA|nr:hypothetical protein PVAND_014508 [Polypedilum vanderplanki]